MRHILLSAAIMMALVGPALADGAAAVKAATPKRGSAPTIVTAYGEAAPASQAVRTLALAQPGQVAAILVTAGQAVRRGQALIRFAVAPASLASFRQAQTAVTLAQGQRAHTQQLLSQQLATRDQLATAQKALADAQAQLIALSRDGAGRAVAVVTAPFDGVVIGLPVSPGDRPAAGATLATIAPSTSLQVSAGIEPGWRRQVQPGQGVRLEPLGGGQAVTGRVIRIDSVLNPKTRLVDVDIAPAEGAAISGQAFRALIVVGSKQGWLVPHDAVLIEDNKAFVFQVANGKAAKIDVSVLQAGRDTDVVDGAIDPHRPLVTTGAYQLEDGAAVRVER